MDDAQELPDPLHLVENDGVSIGKALDEVPEALRLRSRSQEKEARLRRPEEERLHLLSGSHSGISNSGMLNRDEPEVGSAFPCEALGK